MHAFGGMQENSGSPCRSHGRGHFLADQTGFTHAGHYDAAGTGKYHFHRLCKALIQTRSQSFYRIGLYLNNLAGRLNNFCIFIHL